MTNLASDKSPGLATPSPSAGPRTRWASRAQPGYGAPEVLGCCQTPTATGLPPTSLKPTSPSDKAMETLPEHAPGQTEMVCSGQERVALGPWVPLPGRGVSFPGTQPRAKTIPQTIRQDNENNPGLIYRPENTDKLAAQRQARSVQAGSDPWRPHAGQAAPLWPGTTDTSRGSAGTKAAVQGSGRLSFLEHGSEGRRWQ